ncbi:hypothetical protein D3C86_1598440 [compost metagenome]
MFVGRHRLAADDAPVERRAIAQGISQVVTPGIDRIERQGEGERQGQRNADQDVGPTPQSVRDGIVTMPRDNEHGNAGQQCGVSTLANGVVREKSANHRHREVSQPRHAEPGLLHHQNKTDRRTDQCPDGTFGGFFANVAMVLQAADYHEHRHRRPLTVGQVDAGGQQD